MAMQPNAWMTKWLFQSWISHFIGTLTKTVGISAENRHLLVLDGHNSHVTLEVVTLAMNSGLDIISLPSHTSHALQPLDVSCFKPFKTAFRQIRDSWTLVNKGKRVEKTDYVSGQPKHLKNHSQLRTSSLDLERLGYGHLMNLQFSQECSQARDSKRGRRAMSPL